jgi:dipeptide/tripeptide permease
MPVSAQSDEFRSPAPTTHPPAFWFIFWGEFAERCSYYGMRAILPLYLTSILAFPATTAGPLYYWFKMAVYFLPLLGGYLADRFFGKYWTIVGFSVPYVLGHFVLGIESRVTLFFALCLLAMGSGVIKPNIPTLLGLTYDQDRPGQQRLLSSAFRWFYLAVNIGALISQFLMPILRNNYGYRLAFQFPAWLMVAALIAFASGKRHYAVETPGPAATNPEQRRQQWQTLGTLFGFFGLMVFFWFGYEHHDSLWVFFARDYVDRTIPWVGTVVAPDQIQFLNALFVTIFVPTLTALFRLADRDQRIFTPANRILIGFFVTASAIGLVSAAGFAAQGGLKVPLVWIAAAYIALTLGEVLVYATGLELSYTAAPKNMKSFVSACFLVTSTLGNFINIWFSRLYGGSLIDSPDQRGPLLPGPFFGLTTLIVLAAAIASYFVCRRLTRASSPLPPGEG